MRVTWTKGKEANEKERIVSEVREIVAGWGLKMPEKVVLALDFGLGDFRRTGEVEFWVANEKEEGYCGKFLFLFPGQTCPEHHHRKKHETFYIVKGEVSMKAGRRRFRMDEGDCFVMKPGVKHTFSSIGGPALVLEASRPCEPGDSIFVNKEIGRI